MKYPDFICKETLESIAAQINEEYPEANVKVVTYKNPYSARVFVALSQDILSAKEASFVRGILPSYESTFCVQMENANCKAYSGDFMALYLGVFPQYAGATSYGYIIKSAKTITFEDLSYMNADNICKDAFFYSKKKLFRDFAIRNKNVAEIVKACKNAVKTLKLIKTHVLPVISDFNDQLAQFNKKVAVIQQKTAIELE